MQQIVLTAEQAQLFLTSQEKVEVCDSQGRRLGYFSPDENERDIAIALQRKNSNEPRYSFEEVMARIRALENQ